METKAHHVVIGAFVLGLSVLGLVFALWLGKVRFAKEYADYDVLFEQSVSGLSVGAAVQFSGIQVGEVRRLRLAREDPNQVIARIRVQGDLPVSVETRAQLVLTGLTGLAVLRLSGGAKDSPPLTKILPGREVPLIRSEPSELDKLFESSQALLTNGADAFARVNKVLSEENLSKVDRTLSEIQALSTDLRGEAGATLRSIRELAIRSKVMVGKLEKGFPPEAWAQVPVDVRNTLAEINKAARSLEGAAASAGPGLERLSSEGLPQMTSTLAEMERLARGLERLSRTLEANPQGWIAKPPPQRTAEERP